jgi:mannose-6-phosphate isomerase-like protein (cupin superfamily)
VIFEKHVAVPTDKYVINAYSATPEQVKNWLTSAKETFEICGVNNKRYDFTEKELEDLRGLRRGVFAREDLEAGKKINLEDVFLAIPVQENQIAANDFSKYTEYNLIRTVKKNSPILFSDVDKKDLREKVLGIVQNVVKFIVNSKVPVPNKLDFELSHHYGLEKFYEFGTTMINFINREYCKKYVILLPNQKHPEQYHKVKEETFHIMYGSMEVALDGNTKEYKQGDIILVERGVKHKMSTKTGVIIEEISSTHYKDDSFYTDDNISDNKDRKTFITYWLE